MTSEAINPAATGHLPFFITGPGQSDTLLSIMVVVLVLSLIGIGVFYFKLHALPEHMLHGSQKAQLEIVGVLALISLFTHNHLFWIAGLLLAFIDLPDFMTPINSMASSLSRIAHNSGPPPEQEAAPAPETPAAKDAHPVAHDRVEALAKKA
ncbi:hypothetical protein [Prosthecomicrobium sp. N25]|uniref:hypothetical protein n=1 Tax=Prosthecomicrobium sp. N25 TaxID=3129254 RepID=UPI003077FFB5